MNIKEPPTKANGVYTPGKHILLDFWGAKKTTKLDFIKEALTETAKSCNATILETKFHSFSDGGGITGVVILAESHITIHTWPEIDFCAIDIFMCGNCDAENAVEPLKNYSVLRKSKYRDICEDEFTPTASNEVSEKTDVTTTQQAAGI